LAFDSDAVSLGSVNIANPIPVQKCVMKGRCNRNYRRDTYPCNVNS